MVQFSNNGTLEAHGFARNRVWSVDPDPPPFPTNNKAYVDLLLKPSVEDLKIWPHRYIFILSCHVERHLQLMWILILDLFVFGL